jgi:hypothetical protein
MHNLNPQVPLPIPRYLHLPGVREPVYNIKLTPLVSVIIRQYLHLWAAPVVVFTLGGTAREPMSKIGAMLGTSAMTRVGIFALAKNYFYIRGPLMARTRLRVSASLVLIKKFLKI